MPTPSMSDQPMPYQLKLMDGNQFRRWAVLALLTLSGKVVAGSVTFVSADRIAVVADLNIGLLDAGTGEVATTFGNTPEKNIFLEIASSSDRKTVATTNFDGSIKLWDTASGKLIKTLVGASETVWAHVFSPDGKVLASGGDRLGVTLWNVASGKKLLTLDEGSGQPVKRDHVDDVLAFSPDSRTLASGPYRGGLVLWDVATGKRLLTLAQDKSGGVTSAVFSPDGKTLVRGQREGSVKLWNAATGALLRTLVGHSGQVESVAFSPGGKTIASGGADFDIRLWNAFSGALLKTLKGHSQDVGTLAFSPNGKTLLSQSAASSDGSLRVWLWNVASGKVIWKYGVNGAEE